MDSLSPNIHTYETYKSYELFMHMFMQYGAPNPDAFRFEKVVIRFTLHYLISWHQHQYQRLTSITKEGQSTTQSIRHGKA
jgi:hypothetical protein